VTLRETLSFRAANALHRRADFSMPRFTSAVPNFSWTLPIPCKQLLSIRVTYSVASTGRSSAGRREQS
jgi:hypothetical protein